MRYTQDPTQLSLRHTIALLSLSLGATLGIINYTSNRTTTIKCRESQENFVCSCVAVLSYYFLSFYLLYAYSSCGNEPVHLLSYRALLLPSYHVWLGMLPMMYLLPRSSFVVALGLNSVNTESDSFVLITRLLSDVLDLFMTCSLLSNIGFVPLSLLCLSF